MCPSTNTRAPVLAKYAVSTKDLGEAARYLTADELAELIRWVDSLDRI